MVTSIVASGNELVEKLRESVLVGTVVLPAMLHPASKLSKNKTPHRGRMRKTPALPDLFTRASRPGTLPV